MFVCPSCHIENRETAKFCRRCGRAREDEPSSPSDANDAKPKGAKGKTSSSKAASVDEPKASVRGESPAREAKTPAREAKKEKNKPEEQPEATREGADAEGSAIEEPSPPEMTHLMAAGASQCPSCWSAVRASDRFCCWCGQEQPTRLAPYVKVCLECNTHLPERANFCFSCGTDVSHQSRRKVTVPYELFQEEDSELFPRFEV